MGSCDMCGKEGPLFNVRIEGTVMQVCSSCKRHGEVISRVGDSPIERAGKNSRQRRKGRAASESSDSSDNSFSLDTVDPSSLGRRKKVVVNRMIKEDFSTIIKQARESMGLSQEDLAKKLNMKESLIHHFESGRKRPSFSEAERLERFLKIVLVEDVKEDGSSGSFSGRGRASGPLTIGDLLKKKLGH